MGIVTSVLIVVRNAESFILKCIQSVIQQFSEFDSWELLIIDGLSTDHTVKIAQDFLENTLVQFQIIENPKKTLASGWNLGVRCSKGKYVIRPDAHSELLNDYIRIGIKRLKSENDIAAAGGTLITKSDTYIGKLISIVLSNPIGVGTSLFRIGAIKDTYTKTVVYALYKKQIFTEIGGLDESLDRNQDIDFHNRLLDNGYKLLTVHNMKAIYHNRSRLSEFIKQGFQNGFWIIKGSARHIKHLVPLFFVTLMFIASFFSIKVTLLILLFYIFAIIISYSLFSRVYNVFKLIVLVGITFALHISYGIGSIIGLLMLLQIKQNSSNVF